MRLTIATKLSLISAGFIAITAASIIAAFYLGNTRQLLVESVQQYSTLAEQEGRRLSAALTESVDDLQLLARLHPLLSYAEQIHLRQRDDPQLRQQLEQDFTNLLRQHGTDYQQIRFIDTAGQERIRVERGANGLRAVPPADLQDKSGRPYVAAILALAPGTTYFSDITLNLEHGRIAEPHVATLRIATPVGDTAQQVAGILIINIDMGVQLRNVRSALGELSRYAYITNNDGSYLSHHDRNMTFGFESSHDQRIQEMLPELAPFFRDPTSEQVVMMPAENHSDLAVAFRKLNYDITNPQHFITIGIAAPREFILEDGMALIQRNIFWAVLLTLSGIFTALLFSLRLSRPLQTLSEAAQRFIQERTVITSVPPGNDEIAQLGEVIKELTDEVLDNEQRLKTLNATLEQRIDERNRELLASQKMLETVIDALPNRIFWKDTRGNYLGCNRHFATDAGFDTPEALIGLSDQEMPWANYALAYQRDDRHVIDSGEAKLSIIEPITVADGSSHWLETHKLPLRDGEGRIIGILGSYQDITERRDAEAKLRHSEERLRRSQQIAHVGTWDWDLSENTLHWSDEIYAIFGLEPQEFEASYQAFIERIHPADVERVTAAVEYSIDHPETGYSIDHRIVRPNGDIRYVEEHGEIYRDEEGVPTRMIGVVHDITDTTLVQLALYREKERTEHYLQVSEAVIVELDADGRLQRINQRGCDLLGYQMNELLGRNWFDAALPPQVREEVKGVFAQLMQQPQHSPMVNSASYYENELQCRNGELITIAWHNTVNYDDEGRASGTLSSGQDITQRKQIEQMKDEFISTVSHELRTPLTSIHGSLRLILGHVFGEIPQKVLELLQVANNNSERLLALINDLLDVQKIEAQKMSFNFSAVAPCALLSEAVANNRPYAEQHGITLTLQCEPQGLPGQFHADHARLLQVMNNLISNAIKFSPPQGEVEVVACGAAQQFEIAVNDRGPGIPEQHRKQLFDKFTQLDSSDTRSQGGTGLGLHIARLIVEHHQGTIHYHDNPGGGSSFRVTLPLEAAQAQGDES